VGETAKKDPAAKQKYPRLVWVGRTDAKNLGLKRGRQTKMPLEKIYLEPIHRYPILESAKSC